MSNFHAIPRQLGYHSIFPKLNDEVCIGIQTRLLTFASQIDGPLVNNLSPPGYIKTIKLINCRVAVGGHELQHRSKRWAAAAVCADEFTVFVAKPFVTQISISRGNDKWDASMPIQRFEAGIHGNKFRVVDTDDGGQQGQGRLEIRESSRIIFEVRWSAIKGKVLALEYRLPW